MKKLLFILILLASCSQPIKIEQHELTLIGVDIQKEKVYMKDNTLCKNVILDYSFNLFGEKLISLYEQVASEPIFEFLYYDNQYYKI